MPEAKKDLFIGSTNLVIDEPELSGTVTQPDSISFTVLDQDGSAVTISNSAAWSAANSRVELTVKNTEVVVGNDGDRWEFIFVYTFTTDDGTQTVTNYVTYYVRKGVPPSAGGEPSYAEYVARNGSTVPEADFRGYLARTRRAMAAVTYNRYTSATDSDILEKITDAFCVGVDGTYALDTGVVSESFASYSVTYRSGGNTQAVGINDVYAAMRQALSATQLCYQGV